jgi:hypothetical protein
MERVASRIPKWLQIATTAALFIAAVGVCVLHLRAQSSHHATLKEILSDTAVWGNDFPKALSEVLLMHRMGESTVELDRHNVLGTTKYVRMEDASNAKYMLRSAQKSFENFMDKGIDAYFGKQIASIRSKGAVEVVENDPTLDRLMADYKPLKAQRLGIENKALRFFGSITADDLKKRWGDPDKVTSESVPNDGEDREEILTLSQYAGGALTFVVSNLSPIPEGKTSPVVSKVLINSKRVADLIDVKQ